MQVPQVISHETAEITLVRSDKFDDILKDYRCVVCGGVLFQSYSSITSIIPGFPDKDIHDEHTGVFQCKNYHKVYNNGRQFNTRCRAKYVIQ